MPGTDRLAVARALRVSSPGIRVVFVSAQPHFAVDAYGADVMDFVLKPIRRSRLAESVERVRRSQADGYHLWLHTTQRALALSATDARRQRP
jgi:DNA-binding LytR/AlgR family response regulator